MKPFDPRDLGIIRFTSTPHGGAPTDIREQWVGIEVQCLYSYSGKPNPGESIRDVATGQPIPDYPGFVVLQAHALDALRNKSPEAALYWEKLGFPISPAHLFLFDLACATVVKPPLTREEFWRRYADA